MTTVAQELVLLDGIRLELGGRRILEDISLSIRRGELLGLIGPNGGGKTSLLRVLLGILPTTGGTIRWHSTEGRPPRIGYVPQRTANGIEFPLCCAALVEAKHQAQWTR
jgi:zinc transport system ATP-binding protein